jgi:hypothetical protein
MLTETAEAELAKQTQNSGCYLMRLGKSTPQILISGVKQNGITDHYYGESIEGMFSN